MTRSKPPEYIKQRRKEERKQKQEDIRPKSLRRKTVEILGVIGSLASVVGILSFIPHVSVQASGSVRSHDPFGTVFELSNDSPLAIHDVLAFCVVDLKNSGMDLENTGMLLPEGKAAKLSAGQKMTLGCHRALQTDGQKFDVIRLRIEVSYRPDFLWWRSDEEFSMEGLPTQDGTWIWKRLPQ